MTNASTLSSAEKITYVPWILYSIALITALIYNEAKFAETFLKFLVFFSIGLQGLWAATGHLLFPVKTAKGIGWESNGFQTEIGFTNLALGITGTLSLLYPAWITPLSIFAIVFFSGCIYGHIKERLINNNDAPCNSGPMMYSTIAIVLSLIYLCIYTS